jgi:GAF domain-containing protein
VGSCGTAAWRNAPVLVDDIAQDPLWTDFKHLILPLGFKACWSTPICNSGASRSALSRSITGSR